VRGLTRQPALRACLLEYARLAKVVDDSLAVELWDWTERRGSDVEVVVAWLGGKESVRVLASSVAAAYEERLFGHPLLERCLAFCLEAHPLLDKAGAAVWRVLERGRGLGRLQSGVGERHVGRAADDEQVALFTPALARRELLPGAPLYRVAVSRVALRISSSKEGKMPWTCQVCMRRLLEAAPGVARDVAVAACAGDVTKAREMLEGLADGEAAMGRAAAAMLS
jgi:hypothetical protein